MHSTSSTIGKNERASQNRIITLLQNTLNYNYLGDWTHRAENSNIEYEYLQEYLLTKHSPEIVEKAIEELRLVANKKLSGDYNLYSKNKEIYSILVYGVNIKKDLQAKKETVYFIDWENPDNNNFSFAQEVTIAGAHDKRPDIVVYLNGIAIIVLELKRASVSVSEGIRQNIDSQKPEFIEDFFSTNQIILAGNDSEGLRYGTINASEKHYLPWKEQSSEHRSDSQYKLDYDISIFLKKSRLLDFIHNAVAFDGGIKKLARPHQFFALKALQLKLSKKEGGIIWHTQGAGKSLLMIWSATWILQNIPGSRVVVVTDREELDDQIDKNFKQQNKDIVKVSSGKNLLENLNNSTPSLLCTLVHKFGIESKSGFDVFEEELLSNSDNTSFSAKGNIVVFVDECHRTQAGKLHKAMKRILPNAIFVGFTGTPLLKADKQTSNQTFGDYIHTYKFNEAVADDVILDLMYEARNVETYITDPNSIDEWFETKTSGMTAKAKAEVKARWGTLRSLYSSAHRLEKIVASILLDFSTKPRLRDSGRGTALLVASSIEDACKYYVEFKKNLGKKCAIITSFSPTTGRLKGSTRDDSESAELFKVDTYLDMISTVMRCSKDEAMNEGIIDQFESVVLNRFINEPANMKLLIVVNKLLTGFDAPSATYIYLDKKLEDHNLFQAICRVNRLDAGKQFGYIIDYRNQFEAVSGAVSDYTAGSFSGYDKMDVDGLVSNRLKKLKETITSALEKLYSLCEGVAGVKDDLAYIKYFCGDVESSSDLLHNQEKRNVLYKTGGTLINAYGELSCDLEEAGYSKEDMANLKNKVHFYSELINTIKLASGDYIDIKQFDTDMKYLINTYIEAKSSKTISMLNEKSILEVITLLVDQNKENPSDLVNSKRNAEIITGAVRKLIVDQHPTNPVYYEKLSEILTSLAKQQRDNLIDYKNFLESIKNLLESATSVERGVQRPADINTGLLVSLYDNLSNNADLAKDLAVKYIEHKPDSWAGHKLKERQVLGLIKQVLVGHHEPIDKAESILEMLKSIPINDVEKELILKNRV